MEQQYQLIQEIIAAGQRLAAGGLITAHSGNISRRLDGVSLLITASGLFKGHLTPADVLRVDYQGRVLDDSAPGRPSTETFLHTALYTEYPHIQAIVHAHPPYATALATAGQELDWQLLAETRLFLRAAALIPRLEAGSKELAQAAVQAAAGVNALLLAGHGAVSWGETTEEALTRMEILEHTARVMLYQRLFRTEAGHV